MTVKAMIMFTVGLKRMVNLLSAYPDANICGYPTDSDIIMIVLLTIYILNLYPQVHN